MDTFQTRDNCRMCGGPFDDLLSLGHPVLSDFLKPDQKNPPHVPLDLVACQLCDLVQLRHTTNRDLLYRNQYWYQSGINEVMVRELHDVVRSALDRLPKPRVVLDIGANDGTLLNAYPKHHSCLRMAVEPSPTFHEQLERVSDATIADYFPSKTTTGFPTGEVDIITSVAMFYDVDDPKAFVAEVDRLLTPHGLWIVQFQDLEQMVRRTAFDNVCHEHLCYYSVTSFQKLLQGFNLEIVDGLHRPINGGSVRLFVRRRDDRNVAWAEAQLRYEARMTSREILDEFAWRVGEYKKQLRAVLARLSDQKLHVDLYAASTKSSTLLQYCGLDKHWIRQAAERSPAKVGLVTSGTRIPIVSETDWRADPAPATLLGAWQFKEHFLEREKWYLDQGGTFIAPLPYVELICHRQGVLGANA